MSVVLTGVPWYSWVPWDGSQPYCVYEEGRSGLAACPLNTLDTITTTSENSAYPVENLLDAHPKKLYKASSGVNSITLTTTLLVGTNCLFLFNTNAESITINAEDFAYGEWFSGNTWFSENEWWPRSSVSIPTAVVTSGERNAVGLQFTPLIDNKEAVITLVAPAGEAVEVGILWAGVLISANNPSWGLKESQKDYSILKELSNGATYYKKRDIVRTFSGTIFEHKQTSYNWLDKMLLDVSKTYGAKSMPWFITDMANSRWTIFGRLSSPMSGEFQGYTLSNLTFNIIEVF